MLGKLIERVLHEDEELGADNQRGGVHLTDKHRVLGWKWVGVAAIFFVALVPRLYSLFFITDPQNAGVEVWYSDVYHHWQIAYLSKEIGFSRGFLKLWDLKGLEYFWGLGHPLVGALLMGITGSSDIVVLRLLSAVMGSLAITLLYLLVRRYWGFPAGLAAAAMAAFNPVGIFSDASGMVEPLGIFFMLLGIFLIPRVPFLAGLSLAFGSMVRAEYWLLSLLVIVGALWVHHAELANKKMPFALGYTIFILFYLKYLLDNTGNPIYPIWWNFLGNAAGKWQADVAVTPEQLFIKPFYMGTVVLSFVGIFVSLWRRARATPFLLFGFGNWLLWGVVIGMTSYLLSYLPRFWVDRIMLWPYMFLGALLSVFLFSVAPRRLPKMVARGFRALAVLMVVVILVVSQGVWPLLQAYYDDSHKYWENFREIARQVGEADLGVGRVLVSEEWPPLTYMLAHYEGITGKRMVGQMFDPFFYIEGGPYSHWADNREVVLDWFDREDIGLVFFLGGKERYAQLVEREATFFELAHYDQERNLSIYRVKQDVLEQR